MGHSKKILLLLISLLLVTLVIILNVFFFKGDYRVLEGSVLTMLKTLVEDNIEPPDLAIENVSLRKISDPTETFNYYKYNATIVVHNYGGNLIRGQVALRGTPNQKNLLLKTSEDGFTLRTGKSYIIRDYEVILDANYNGGDITLELDVVDGIDYYKDNNYFTSSLFEGPAKIDAIELREILEDGTFVLDFESNNFLIRKHQFTVQTGEAAVFDKEDLRYAEVSTDNGPLGYHRFRNSEQNIRNGFKAKESTELESHLVKFGENPFETGNEKYVFIKIINPDTGFYAVSNVLAFDSQEEMTRAQLAKLFVEYAGVEIFDAGNNHYRDLNDEEWYASYIQTLYNLGLIDTTSNNYRPDEIVHRSEAIGMVLNYFDVDLVIPSTAPHFVDVEEDSLDYVYAESFFESASPSFIKDNLYPDLPASKDFLKYLVNEYSRSN